MKRREKEQLAEMSVDGNVMEKQLKKSNKGRTALTAAVIIAVIILNAVISAVGDARMWYADMTDTRYKSEITQLYTLSDECRDLVGRDAVSQIETVNAQRTARGEDEIKLKVVFCSDKDIIEGDALMCYVSYTARALANEFPHAIEVEYINIEQNPSAVQKYKTTSAATIYNSDIIVEFGSEYLVHKISSFYYQDSTEDTPWAYNGEQRLAATILALTRAESPVCALTYNHGEQLFDGDGNIKAEYSEFIKLVGGAGYDVITIDLENDVIPENCRMIITFAPTRDFYGYGNMGQSGVSEIEKLDRYLDGSNSFFYVCNPETPKLANLEEYLEEWGVAVARENDASGVEQNYVIRDEMNCTDVGLGKAVLGNYVDFGLGGKITEDMRKSAYPARIVFPSSTAIRPSDTYNRIWVRDGEETDAPVYSYYNYYRNGINRNLLEIFTTYSTANAEVGGDIYEVATEQSRFRLMTITQEERQVQEGDYSSVNKASYVLALASTDFLGNELLTSTAYGNADVVLSALRNTSAEIVPTDVEIKVFYIYGIEDNAAYAQVGVQGWLLGLCIAPSVVLAVVGAVVIIRRKYR